MCSSTCSADKRQWRSPPAWSFPMSDRLPGARPHRTACVAPWSKSNAWYPIGRAIDSYPTLAANWTTGMRKKRSSPTASRMDQPTNAAIRDSLVAMPTFICRHGWCHVAVRRSRPVDIRHSPSRPAPSLSFGRGPGAPANYVSPMACPQSITIRAYASLRGG